MRVWVALIGASVAGYALKAIGYLVPARHLGHRTVTAVVAMTPVALLAALVAVQTFATGRHLAVDARVAGLAVAAGLLVVRVPFVGVVAAAALTAAGLRALGVG